MVVRLCACVRICVCRHVCACECVSQCVSGALNTGSDPEPVTSAGGTMHMSLYAAKFSIAYCFPSSPGSCLGHLPSPFVTVPPLVSQGFFIYLHLS